MERRTNLMGEDGSDGDRALESPATSLLVAYGDSPRSMLSTLLEQADPLAGAD